MLLWLNPHILCKLKPINHIPHVRGEARDVEPDELDVLLDLMITQSHTIDWSLKSGWMRVEVGERGAYSHSVGCKGINLMGVPPLPPGSEPTGRRCLPHCADVTELSPRPRDSLPPPRHTSSVRPSTPACTPSTLLHDGCYQRVCGGRGLACIECSHDRLAVQMMVASIQMPPCSDSACSRSTSEMRARLSLTRSSSRSIPETWDCGEVEGRSGMVGSGRVGGSGGLRRGDHVGSRVLCGISLTGSTS